MVERWIKIREDDGGLWTADLYEGEKIIKTLGGGYPKSHSASIDAHLTWGQNLKLILVMVDSNVISKKI